MPRIHHPRREPGEYPRSASALRSALIDRAVSVARRKGVVLKGEIAEEVHEAAEKAGRLLAARIAGGARFTAGDAVAVDRAFEGMGKAVVEALRSEEGLEDDDPIEDALEKWVLDPLKGAGEFDDDDDDDDDDDEKKG